MTDETTQTVAQVSPAVQLELDMLRDQRDLYRSLLLAEPESLRSFLRIALKTVEGVRVSLRTPTRDHAAFRRKIERLRVELSTLADAMLGLHLPTVSARLASAQQAVGEVEGRDAATGNDLLPTMVVLEELCSHITIAVDCAAVHVPIESYESADADVGATPAAESGAAPAAHESLQLKLTEALEQLAEKATTEHGKRVGLVTLGLEEIPEEWVGTLFDMLGQLLRNAVEHGIEPSNLRVEHGKPAIGTLVIEFVARGADGYELNVQDDGGGLDAERICAAAVKLGWMKSDEASTVAPARLMGLLFQPGLTTAADPRRHGLGMSIVRDHVQRLGGKLQLSSKRGRFTRYRITLPPLAQPANAGSPAG
jgi:signal transduction histidine kinase